MVNDIYFQQFSQLLDKKLTPIQKDLRNIQKVQQSHGELLQSLKKDQAIMLNFFDHELIGHSKRLDHAEQRLDAISPLA